MITSSPPLVSVVMPCYNAEASVERAITSIQSQTLTDWELIVVDDGSTDASANIITSLAKQDSRIRYFPRNHGGVVTASNHGYSKASGTYIARMDADDVSRPDRLAEQVTMLTNNLQLDVVSCLVHFAGDPDSAGGYAYHVDWANQQLSRQEIKNSRFIDLPLPHPTLMYKRSLINQFGGYRDGDFPEDYEILLRWIESGVTITKVSKILYDWHDPRSRLSRYDSRYDMMAFHRCKAPYLAKAIYSSGCGQRDLWIWGAGRPARKCAQPLEASWKPATGFIDIDPKKIDREIRGRPVVSANNLPATNSSVIVSYVGTRGARDKIRAALIEDGRIEGIDFWIAA